MGFLDAHGFADVNHVRRPLHRPWRTRAGPLQVAMERGDVEMMELLFQKGSDPHLQFSKGRRQAMVKERVLAVLDAGRGCPRPCPDQYQLWTQEFNRGNWEEFFRVLTQDPLLSSSRGAHRLGMASSDEACAGDAIVHMRASGFGAREVP